MPLPASNPPRPNENKTKAKTKAVPKNERPKTMPQANRDKCGACSQNHDIRYCPYPNTEDGRTKVCPICNSSKHAWFECWYYKRDVMEQWTICWANRRCLPTLVHNAPLDEIFHSRVSLARETTNTDGPSPLENFNILPGPLSPAFVKKLMPPDVGDAHIHQELQEGRLAPWELKRGILEDNVFRSKGVIRDKSTMDMRIDRFIDGTRSSAEGVPAASKQDFFLDMENAMKANDDVYNEILAKKPLPSLKAIIPPKYRFNPQGKWGKCDDDDDEMAVTCDNCGTEGHDILECPTPCKECGKSMPHHAGQLSNGQCKLGCLCRDDPGHKRPDCDRLCRPCFIENRDSTTVIKDCKKHCQLHMCHTQDGQGQSQNHSRCVEEHDKCPSCHGRHWHQDCPRWLGTLCLRQDCLGTKCNIHCHTCGGCKIDEIMSLFPKNGTPSSVLALVRTWHEFLDNWQWERVQAPAAAACIEFSPWSFLRCRRHENVTADACILEKKRAHTWKMVVDCVRGGFTEGTVSKAKRLLQIPECRDCFDQWLYPIELVLEDSTRGSQKQRAAGLSP